MNRDSSSGLEEMAESPAKAAFKAPPVPVLDPADYAEDMAEFDMTEDQKREFLEILWSIMRSFAELGFTVDLCGQLFEEFNEAAGPGLDGVEFEGSTKAEKSAGKESSS